jgi:hypothetical protein
MLRPTRAFAVATLVLVPALAPAGMNKNFLVPAFSPCIGKGSCPPARASTFTFETATLQSPAGRYIAAGKLALKVELKGVRDASGGLVTTNASDPTDDFKIVLGAGQVTIPGVGTLPVTALPDTEIPFDLRDGKAKVTYRTPDVTPSGLVTEGGVVSIVDNQGHRLATVGSQSKP